MRVNQNIVYVFVDGAAVYLVFLRLFLLLKTAFAACQTCHDVRKKILCYTVYCIFIYYDVYVETCDLKEINSVKNIHLLLQYVYIH